MAWHYKEYSKSKELAVAEDEARKAKKGLWTDKEPVPPWEYRKKEREAKKAQTKIEVKEIRLRPKTNEAHRGFKVDDARRWLNQGHKVRVTIKFRGREMDYPEIALEDLKEIAQSLADISMIETPPQMEGRTMLVVLAPAKPGAKKKEKGDQPQVQKAAETPE